MRWLKIYYQAVNVLMEGSHLVHVEQTRQDQIQRFRNCSNLSIFLQHTPNVYIKVNVLKQLENSLE